MKSLRHHILKNHLWNQGEVLANAKDNSKGNNKDLQNVTVVDNLNNSMKLQEGVFKEHNVKNLSL